MRLAGSFFNSEIKAFNLPTRVTAFNCSGESVIKSLEKVATEVRKERKRRTGKEGKGKEGEVERRNGGEAYFYISCQSYFP